VSPKGYQPMDAPQLAPPRLGLLQSVLRPSGVPSRWRNGITFLPENAEAAAPETHSWWSCPDVDEGGQSAADVQGSKGLDTAPPLVDYHPWTPHVDDTCSTDTTRDYVGRARRRLAATLGRQVESELWTGRVAQAAGYPNNFLANSGSPFFEDLGTVNMTGALPRAQQFIADTIEGRGTIHANYLTVGLWAEANAVRREGNVLLDVFDNIVVPGTGYPGTGVDGEEPSPGQAFVFVTGLITYLEDNEVTLQPPKADMAIDPALNDVAYHAEKHVAAFWDGICHGMLSVDLNTVCPPFTDQLVS
jgi:hypothetical protein